MTSATFPPPRPPSAAFPPPRVPSDAELSSVAPPPPTTARRTDRAVVAWLLGGLLLFGAWLIVGVTPSQRDLVAPFDVATPFGEWGTGRNLTARVTDAQWTDSIDDGTPHRGNWLVLKVDAATITTDEDATLGHADLTINGVTYTPTDRAVYSIKSYPLTTGIPLTGSLAYEIPEDRMNGVAELHLALDLDPQLDSVIVIPVDLDDLEHTDSVSLEPPTWATP